MRAPCRNATCGLANPRLRWACASDQTTAPPGADKQSHSHTPFACRIVFGPHVPPTPVRAGVGYQPTTGGTAVRFSRDAFDTQHLRAMTERLHWHRKSSAKAVPLSMR
ncbi:hypothetical protein C0Z20_30905, partial [Trinickia symbiotica]